MKTNTKPAPTRCPWQQGFRDALQRLTMTLMLVMMTATAAWAVDTMPPANVTTTAISTESER